MDNFTTRTVEPLDISDLFFFEWRFIQKKSVRESCCIIYSHKPQYFFFWKLFNMNYIYERVSFSNLLIDSTFVYFYSPFTLQSQVAIVANTKTGLDKNASFYLRLVWYLIFIYYQGHLVIFVRFMNRDLIVFNFLVLWSKHELCCSIFFYKTFSDDPKFWKYFYAF
jgi:hypothetical protein